MAIIKLKSDPSDRELRQFAGMLLPLFCVVISALAYARGSTRTAIGVLTIGLLIGAIGYVRVAFIRPLFLAWIYAAYPIGWVVSHAILAIVFYLLVTPVGWVMKLVKYDPLERQFARSAKTYWAPIEAPLNKTSYFRQF
jgi:hypothetical protein